MLNLHRIITFSNFGFGRTYACTALLTLSLLELLIAAKNHIFTGSWAINEIQNKNKDKLKTNNGKKSYHLTIMSKRTGWKSDHLLNMI